MYVSTCFVPGYVSLSLCIYQCVCIFVLAPICVCVWTCAIGGETYFVYVFVYLYFYMCFCISVYSCGRVGKNPSLCLHMPVSVDVPMGVEFPRCYDENME